MQVTIECQKRPEGSKPNTLRRQGLIPAALYGHKGTESISLIIKEKDAQLLLKKASVNNTLVDVNIPDVPWSGKALIREVQTHPWKRFVYHLSFFSVAAHGKIDVVVPLNLVGESSGVKQGGIIEQVITEISVQCLPESIPETIEIDISPLKIGDSISVGDLQLSEGVTYLDDPTQTILTVMAPKKGSATEEETAEASA
ncbi:ribosomal 5S rRNA E-loop binding protein Ctc/L25/TL5 [Gloeothece citriformis PCC 7424]|uniref:Large ribosomal subunit protein bL25 n=1 Tax=Gloeothece citriformis (strain PCC 7424) TaxID=65393 RepID=RL25_GLOC7|nr:50S ribosomal protein L25/general stress protein Ctc [Gloeothece citriformis]B7KCY0.1 RecName: Full=Large ribosomal subunit protein bL25; AltName: Full=50S ribosomal protein L25; AltName: Full=General stress protein CTC [Gloeothece citriformis PCC 7424]ACK73101.1 ribosomal 5S rRNA E-loop binding protein Ctc/L25/TL5 [Gloeothece citriformis PCC 7424]